MKNVKLRNLIALCLSFALILTLFTSCSKKDNDGDDFEKGVEEEQDNEKKPTASEVPDCTSPTIPGNDDTQTEEKPDKIPWVVKTFSEAADVRKIYATNFYEDYAFVSFLNGGAYIIDNAGNLKFSLGDLRYTVSDFRFSNGLCFIPSLDAPMYLIDTQGNKHYAEDFGGTELYLNRELLAGGYFVVDRVISTFDGAAYESAIYNTNMELVQAYSTELYQIFHEIFGESYNTSFYNGYLVNRTRSDGYLPDTEAYHIATNTVCTVKDIVPEHKMDLAYYSEKRMQSGDAVILDLSQYTTLYRIEYIGDLGIAAFRNEEGDCFFTVIDTEGNFKFDPINYGQYNYCKYYINKNIIVTETHSSQYNSTAVQINAYDWEGNLLGSLDLTARPTISLGIDSLLIAVYENNTIGYYDFNLKPMFPTE